ncbi:MAG: YkgB family protein [Methylocella sp.]
MTQSTVEEDFMADTVVDPSYSYIPGMRAGSIGSLGAIFMRCGLAVIFLWFGAMKFTSYEAVGVAEFVSNSPLVGWWHAVLGIQGTSNMLGVYEIATGVLLLAGFANPRLSAVGGAMAVITFLTTLSFFFTTPGVGEPLAGGFPALSAKPGQFLLKDLGLLGISIAILGEPLWRARFGAVHARATTPVSGGWDEASGAWILRVGRIVIRYGLALIFVWYGCMKFTSYEATGIAPFIANSPLVGWWHSLLGIQGASYMLGVIEIATGILLAVYTVAPRAAVMGGAMAVLTYLITLSFFLTTPGVAAPMGFPAISVDVGQFLLKDLGLLGASIWLLGEALGAAADRESVRRTRRSDHRRRTA